MVQRTDLVFTVFFVLSSLLVLLYLRVFCAVLVSYFHSILTYFDDAILRLVYRMTSDLP